MAMHGILAFGNIKHQTRLKNKISFPMYEDNEGAIQIAKHPISNSNSKHIDVRHHFLRELVERKEIEIIHIASQYQHADFLTKALPEREFEFHRGIVMNLM